jgi:hypothetical protein
LPAFSQSLPKSAILLVGSMLSQFKAFLNFVAKEIFGITHRTAPFSELRETPEARGCSITIA